MKNQDLIPPDAPRSVRKAHKARSRHINTWMPGLQKAMWWKKNRNNLFNHNQLFSHGLRG